MASAPVHGRRSLSPSVGAMDPRRLAGRRDIDTTPAVLEPRPQAGLVRFDLLELPMALEIPGNRRRPPGLRRSIPLRDHDSNPPLP
jgi:hypothetical protein